MYPEKFEELIALFEKLPGVGSKTAQRYAFVLLEKDREEIARAANILNGIGEIRKCRICGFLSDDDECAFCKDGSRDRSQIMVVAYPQDVVAIEKTGSYQGTYHVLGGLISSSKGIYPEDINIEKLLERINDDVKEVIIATSPTMDGEMTALYLDKILKDRNILVTRLAHGLPMGASLDYADDLTLIKALDNRRKIESD
ncbi:MAG: recombination protein RecR [Erysipelotrichaceae bacterium]|jgi:recombination protein RecR|nr:recombination protein RecR [Erysipelotrichaceae bacterium]